MLSFLRDLEFFPFVYTAIFFAFCQWIHTPQAHAIVIDLQRHEHGHFLAGPVAQFTLMMFLFHAYGGALSLIDHFRPKSLSRFKIHRRDTLGYWDMMPTVLFNQFFVWLPTVLFTFYIGGGRGMRLSTEIPSTLQMAIHLGALFLGFEVLFYFGHRLEHKPFFYSWCHQKHHLSKGSVGISSMYGTPIDGFLMTIAPGLLAPALLDSHVFVTYIAIVIGTLNGVHSHSAYRFPFMPSPDDHELHHGKYTVNYALGPLDTILDTAAHRSREQQAANTPALLVGRKTPQELAEKRAQTRIKS